VQHKIRRAARGRHMLDGVFKRGSGRKVRKRLLPLAGQRNDALAPRRGPCGISAEEQYA
jgi:hypothetical protein